MQHQQRYPDPHWQPPQGLAERELSEVSLEARMALLPPGVSRSYRSLMRYGLATPAVLIRAGLLQQVTQDIPQSVAFTWRRREERAE